MHANATKANVDENSVLSLSSHYKSKIAPTNYSKYCDCECYLSSRLMLTYSGPECDIGSDWPEIVSYVLLGSVGVESTSRPSECAVEDEVKDKDRQEIPRLLSILSMVA